MLVYSAVLWFDAARGFDPLLEIVARWLDRKTREVVPPGALRGLVSAASEMAAGSKYGTPLRRTRRSVPSATRTVSHPSTSRCQMSNARALAES